ncbi:hypothetical protein DL96DRAFT_1581884 [Flagelloscypha sp. PMI_526]|nr:hypothetical protein DL96DRAFT_1581884 [Flagelloscypha sp. PMI_526]
MPKHFSPSEPLLLSSHDVLFELGSFVLQPLPCPWNENEDNASGEGICDALLNSENALVNHIIEEHCDDLPRHNNMPEYSCPWDVDCPPMPSESTVVQHVLYQHKADLVGLGRILYRVFFGREELYMHVAANHTALLLSQPPVYFTDPRIRPLSLPIPSPLLHPHHRNIPDGILALDADEWVRKQPHPAVKMQPTDMLTLTDGMRDVSLTPQNRHTRLIPLPTIPGSQASMEFVSSQSSQFPTRFTTPSRLSRTHSRLGMVQAPPRPIMLTLEEEEDWVGADIERTVVELIVGLPDYEGPVASDPPAMVMRGDVKEEKPPVSVFYEEWVSMVKELKLEVDDEDEDQD